MSEETAPVTGETAGRAAGTGLCLDTIISADMHLFSAMFLLVMLAAMPCKVRTPASTSENALCKSYEDSAGPLFTLDSIHATARAKLKLRIDTKFEDLRDVAKSGVIL